jgi:hypothetical protein
MTTQSVNSRKLALEPTYRFCAQPTAEVDRIPPLCQEYGHWR